MKKLLFVFVALLALVGAWAGRSALASSYEWITYALLYPSDVIHGGQELKISRDVNTSGSYLEYRSAYFQFSTTTFSEGSWNEWTDCRVSSTVSGTEHDVCYPIVSTSTAPMATSTLWVRVSTNFAGCGTYTPTPDIANCGYSTTTSVLYTP